MPFDLREASCALGVTKQRTITKIVLRTALPGIVSARSSPSREGSAKTAPLLMTAGYIASTNVNLFSGQMTTLPVCASTRNIPSSTRTARLPPTPRA